MNRNLMNQLSISSEKSDPSIQNSVILKSEEEIHQLIENSEAISFDHLPTEERIALAKSLPQHFSWAQGDLLGDEWANSLTHGIGFILSCIALVVLLFSSLEGEDYWKILSFTVYGSSLVILYAASTLYHSASKPDSKKKLQVVDHCAIYLLIAGTYTPFTLLVLDHPSGISLFTLAWGLAGVGILFKIFFTNRFRIFSTTIYLLMGWMILFVAESFINHFPYHGLLLILAGGVCYTGGIVFYLMDQYRFFHAIWHVFVLGGSFCHFLAIFLYI